MNQQTAPSPVGSVKAATAASRAAIGKTTECAASQGKVER